MPEHPALRIDNLKFRYHRRRKNEPWVIDIPALTLQQGEQMLLTGGSGRGKSTLLHLICGLMDPVEGETYVSGKPIHSLHGAARDLFRGKRIGMIFQNFNLLHGFSALENVMAPMMFSSIPRNQHRRRARYLLHHLGILHPRKHPEKLSIGQQQRIAVARAVACDPVLVLADEPTASLDPENSQKAMQLIQNLCRERSAALLCVSHDPEMCSRFNLRASLDELAEGRVPARTDASASGDREIPIREVPRAASTETEDASNDETDVELDLEGQKITTEVRDPTAPIEEAGNQ